MDAALVVNAHARRGAERSEAARQALRDAGVRLVFEQDVVDPERLAAAMARAVQTGAPVLIAAGGDGTMSCAANHLAGRSVTLGVLPCGTANDFARALGIPRDLTRAAEMIARGRSRRVDLGVINGAFFLNAASVGLTSDVARNIRPLLKRAVGPLAYPLTMAREALRFEPFALELTADDRRCDGLAYQVVVGNGRFHGGGRLVAPEATLEDGVLDVYVVTASAEAPSVAELARLARIGLLLRRGRHIAHPAVEHLRARRVRVATAPSYAIDIDGELRGQTPATFEVAPRILEVYGASTSA